MPNPEKRRRRRHTLISQRFTSVEKRTSEIVFFYADCEKCIGEIQSERNENQENNSGAGTKEYSTISLVNNNICHPGFAIYFYILAIFLLANPE